MGVAPVHRHECDVEVLNVAMRLLQGALGGGLIGNGSSVLLLIVFNAVVDRALAAAVPVATLRRVWRLWFYKQRTKVFMFAT